jgi:hypothetical protein
MTPTDLQDQAGIRPRPAGFQGEVFTWKWNKIQNGSSAPPGGRVISKSIWPLHVAMRQIVYT